MTVKQLIEALGQFDQEFPVLLYDDEWSGLRDTLNPEIRTVILNAVDPGIGERPPHIEHEMLDVVEPHKLKNREPTQAVVLRGKP